MKRHRSSMQCINCSKKGHSFKECAEPINSYGILAYKITNGIPKYLLVQRKDTMGYIDFIRGKYSEENKNEMIKNFIDEMTSQEKTNLLVKTFDELWNELWTNHQSRTYINDYRAAKVKYHKLDIDNLIKSSEESEWNAQEYGIPKGRRNNKETPLNCAIREFMEETGYRREDFHLENRPVLKEEFLGSNETYYKHIYYIARVFSCVEPSVDQKNILQTSEIKDIKWFDYHDAINVLRNYDMSKRTVITYLNLSLTQT